MMRTTGIVVLLLVLVGCASDAGPSTPTPPDHPAAANAQSSDLPRPRLSLSMPQHGGLAQQAASPATQPATQPATRPSEGPQLYACPMHPQVTSADPNARCPECGMKINKPVAAPAPAEEPGDHAHHGDSR
jgi:hypothetical protein